MPKTISQLPAASSANANAVVAADNATGTLTEKVTLGAIATLAPVQSVAGKTGAVTLSVSDVTGAAPAANPAFTGNATFTASAGVPVTITNTGTGTSFVVNDEAADGSPFVIDGNGAIGVGTPTPTFESASFTGVQVHNNAAGGATAVRLTNAGTGVTGSSDGFDISVTAGGAAYVWNRENNNLGFGTNNQQRMTITADANMRVGIGTDTPTFASASVGGLQCHNPAAGGASSLRLTNSGSTTANSRGLELQFDSTLNGYLIFRETSVARSFQIFTHGSERMRFTFDGTSAFAVMGGNDGTATPTATILRGPARTGTDVVGTDFTIAAGNGTGAGGGGAIIFQTASPGTTGATANTFAERMRVNAVGNVSIGLAAPTFTVGSGLHVHSTTAQGGRANIRLTTEQSGTLASVGGEIAHDGNSLWVMNRQNNTIRFSTNGVERMRMDGGSVIIGGSVTGNPAFTDAQTGIHHLGSTLRLGTSRTPTVTAGNTGEICWDVNFLYVCVGPNTWKKVALTAI